MMQARTFQARIDGHAALAETAELLSRAERCLWAEMAKGRKPNECKNEFLRRFGVTARQFNALAVAAKGKALSLKEIGKLRPPGRRKAAGPSPARTARAAPAWDGSLAEDAAFLANPVFPPRAHDGAIPSREPSAKRLGGRPCVDLLKYEQICTGFQERLADA